MIGVTIPPIVQCSWNTLCLICGNVQEERPYAVSHCDHVTKSNQQFTHRFFMDTALVFSITEEWFHLGGFWNSVKIAAVSRLKTKMEKRGSVWPRRNTWRWRLKCTPPFLTNFFATFAIYTYCEVLNTISKDVRSAICYYNIPIFATCN